jgi:hypothetical protein
LDLELNVYVTKMYGNINIKIYISYYKDNTMGCKHKGRRLYLDVLKVHFYVKDNILMDLSESK